MPARPRARSVALLTSALLLLTASPAAAAGSFWDDDGSVHERAVEGLAAAGVTRSCDPGVGSRFCPSAPVLRGQMAAFLVRALRLPPATRDHFRDDAGSVFEDDVDRLAEAGLTRGCNPPANDRFCPGRIVSRAEMASFLDRAYAPAATTRDAFVDDDGLVHEGAIDRIARAGVTRGCDPPTNQRFCPRAPVTRAEMASFLARADEHIDALDPDRLHERVVTYEVAVSGAVDRDLLPVLRRRAQEAMYAEGGWHVDRRLLLELVADGGDFRVVLAEGAEIGRYPGCSSAYSCTVGDTVLVNRGNFTSRPSPWRGESQAAYQRYVVLHEVGHWLDFDDTADRAKPNHYNDVRYCQDVDGDGQREAPVMKQQSIRLDGCAANGTPLPFEVDCVEQVWLRNTTDQGARCPHR